MLSGAEQKNISTTKGPNVYPSCKTHSDCGTNQFCGVKCWTGGCDKASNSKKTRGNFCQPCTNCTKHTDSVTHGCEVCGFSGNIRDFHPRTFMTVRCEWVANFMLTHMLVTTPVAYLLTHAYNLPCQSQTHATFPRPRGRGFTFLKYGTPPAVGTRIAE